jgi:tripartite-type tricarboxylate transporter receptor subunit TctC
MRCLLLLCALLSFGALGAAADDYPSRPIRLIVPFAAGGAVDTVARVITNPLNARLAR